MSSTFIVFSGSFIQPLNNAKQLVAVGAPKGFLSVTSQITQQTLFSKRSQYKLGNGKEQLPWHIQNRLAFDLCVYEFL